jgi:putative nucleotidyltransferase with HDIG domain
VSAILYRVKQFLWYFDFKIKDKEKKYVLNKLGEVGYKIFTKLSIPEQKHSIRVTRKVEQICESYKTQGIALDKNTLIVASLLHDIGKSYKKLNVVDKSIIVILNKLTKGKLRKYTNLKKIDTYYNHAEKGAKILREYNYDERVIYLVENHHINIEEKKSITKDIELMALIESDSTS